MNWNEEIKSLEGQTFGDSAELIDALAELVATGKKTATSSLLASYKDENIALPKVGNRSYVMNSNKEPVCVIEITSVEIIPFTQVDEAFARAEGEGDLTLAYWRDEHRRFFKEIYPQFHEEMEVVCERFKVLWVF